MSKQTWDSVDPYVNALHKRYIGRSAHTWPVNDEQAHACSFSHDVQWDAEVARGEHAWEVEYDGARGAADIGKGDGKRAMGCTELDLAMESIARDKGDGGGHAG